MPDFFNNEIVNGLFTDPTDILFVPNGVTSLTLTSSAATFGVPLYGDGSGLTGITASSTPFTGGTVTGATTFTSTLSASTISATTFYGSSKKMTNPKIGIFGAYISAQYYDYGLNGTVATTKAMAANEVSISPMVWPEDFSADRIGLNITATGATGTMVRFLIFDSDSDGKPNNLIYSSTTASTTTTGFKEITLSQTFEKNVVYWAGAQFNGICTMSALPPSGCFNLGTTSSVSTPAISIRNILGSFTAPANFAAIGTWTLVRTTLTPPLIRFRKA